VWIACGDQLGSSFFITTVAEKNFSLNQVTKAARYIVVCGFHQEKKAMPCWIPLP
jgi:galactitol-specific phosphotransferase system IIB component